MILKEGLHILIGLTYLTAFLAVSESVQAEVILQQQGRLERGDQVIQSDGSLADFYTFTGQAGQQIRITLESSEFDAYLILIDSDRNKIAENDDANQGTHNAELVLTLPESGTYAVVVNGYDRGDRGWYELTISSGSNSAPASSSAMMLQDLPDGDYRYYDGPPINNDPPPRRYYESALLRKTDNTVVGIHLENLDSDPCFRGVVRQNTISSITYGYQESSRSGPQPWQFRSSSDSIDLDIFQSRSRSLEGRERLLEYCVEGMAGQ